MSCAYRGGLRRCQRLCTSISVSPRWRLPGRGRVGGSLVPHQSSRPMPRAIKTTATMGPARLDLLDPLDQDGDEGPQRRDADERVEEGRDDVER
jgi:hypothetical protein